MASIFFFNNESPSALGIQSFTRTRRSQAADTLTITLGVDADASLLWRNGNKLTVTKDGNVWFFGTVLTPARSMNDRAQGIQITVMGAWWNLERKPFLITHTTPGVAIGTVNTGSRRALFINPLNGAPETTKQTLTRIMTEATTAIPSIVSGTVPFNFPSLIAPTEKATDRSLAQVILAVMRYHMDWGTRMTGARSLSFIKRGQQQLYFDVGGGVVRDAKPVIREDMVPSGVILRYEREGAVQSSTGYRSAILLDSRTGSYAIDVYPRGKKPTDENVLVETITLKKGEPVPPFGWAEAYYRTLADHPLVDGSMTLTDQGCDTGIEPCHTINLIGTHAPVEWASMQAFVSEVVETPYEGLTEVRFGLPPHLALKDWVDLMRLQSRWRVRDELAANDTPVEDPPDTQLTGYVTRRDIDAKWVFRVTPGHVSDGITERVPFWMETSNTLEVVAPIVPIELLLVEGHTVEAWLYVNWRPQPTEFGLVTDGGGTFSEWRDTGAGVIDEARIRFAAVDAQVPVVGSGGSITNGHLYFKLGTVSWPLAAAGPTFSVRRTGNIQILHSPPNKFYLVPAVAADD